ncbi:bifunctional farnesyl-diphosphate farnesyltransferase/squalene synthase [Umbelopsis sp. WA50703]
MLGVLLASLFHPSELNALVTYKFLRPESNIQRNKKLIANNKTKKRCYELLDLTSRSFSAVIQELDDELRDPICLFYLALRGLDTIEDDMTLDLDRKCELLRSFDKIIYQRGWNFTDSGPNEKDRQLLVEFDIFIEEFLLLPKKYQDVIADITKKMGNGMADYASGDHRENTAVATIKDFDLYCHYVAGLVGWGLSDLFAATGLEDPSIADDKRLSDSMGSFLQKTNIIRDYREDLDDGRQFWPKEIWGQYTDDFAGLTKPENADTAQAVLSAMVLNVLELIPDVLTYLSSLKHQSVFNFCAIPQVMAIATLALVFNNKDVYQKNVKMRKGEAVKLIMAATNIHNVVAIFREYLHILSKKNDARDPNFMNISIAVGRAEQWITTNIPDAPHALVKSTSSASTNLILLAVLAGIAAVLYNAYA